MTHELSDDGSSVRDWLRSLQPFPAELAVFDTEAAPADPVGLFLSWLRDAIASGVPAPHAMTLSTNDENGPNARTLILKDVSEAGWSFAKSANSPTGRALHSDPRAALTFFWPLWGRQVRVRGSVRAEPPEVAAADFLARPESSRISTLIGHQSETMSHRESYADARAEARAKLDTNPDLLATGWSVWVLEASAVEFWQAAADRAHTRVLYERSEGGWSRQLLWP